MADERNGEKPQPFGTWRHRASQFYLLLVLLGFPMFSAPCPKGSCSSPVEVVAVHLVSNGVNDAVAKVILYPSALFLKMESIVAEDQPVGLPDWDSLLENITRSLKDKEQSDTTFGLCLIIGSYLCLAGAIACVLGPTLFSAFGPLVLLLCIYNEGRVREDVYFLPMFSIALFCAASGIKFLGRAANSSASPGDSTTGNDEKARSSSSEKKSN